MSNNCKGRVAVIGAGTAGLCAAKNALEKDFKVVVYEQTRTLGGVWNYTDETGVDMQGIPKPYMYKDLTSNVPKEIMRFTDFDYGSSVGNRSFVKTDEVLAFLTSYAEKFKLNDVIQYEHQVIRVLPKGKKWEILVKDLDMKRYSMEVFDFVIVANGYNSTPNWPEIKGQELFNGQQKHCFDFRHAEEFQGENLGNEG